MFLSGWELLFQVLLLVNIASYTAAMAHFSISSLDSQYRLLNIISCGIFLLSSPGRLTCAATDELLLTFPSCHIEEGEDRQGQIWILQVFKCLKKVQFNMELGDLHQ